MHTHKLHCDIWYQYIHHSWHVVVELKLHSNQQVMNMQDRRTQCSIADSAQLHSLAHYLHGCL